MLAWLLAGLGILLLVAVQASLAVHLAIAGFVPDLPLAAALALALHGGPTRGALAGVAVGLALDLLHGSHLGLFALSAGIAAWACGEAAARVDSGRGLVRWVIATLCAGLYGALVVGLWTVLGHRIDTHGAVRQLSGAALYDGVLAALAYWPVAAAGRRGLSAGASPRARADRP